MREDMVIPATARRLAAEGFTWRPELGDWCTILGAEHAAETRVGLWLVVGLYPQAGLLLLADATGQWPASQVSEVDCLWLPTIGKLKVWLRSRGFRVATGETSTPWLGAASPASRHVCRLTRSGSKEPLDGEGSSEAEALADTILQLLGAETADSLRVDWP